MTFNPSIPQSTDLISVSQGQLLTNFTQLNTQFAVDHNAFNTASANGNGHHKKISFDNAIAPSAPTGTQSVLYPSLVNGSQELVFRNATTTTILTGPTTIAANGSVTVGGGITIKWGTFAVLTGTPVSFASAFLTNCFSVNVTLVGSGEIGIAGAPTTTTFTPVHSTLGVATGYYIAIGN